MRTTVVEMREALRGAGLPTSGGKAQLQRRFKKARTDGVLPDCPVLGAAAAAAQVSANIRDCERPWRFGPPSDTGGLPDDFWTSVLCKLGEGGDIGQLWPAMFLSKRLHGLAPGLQTQGSSLRAEVGVPQDLLAPHGGPLNPLQIGNAP